MKTGDAVFKGTYRTVEKFPLVCGPFKVPFLLKIPGSGQRITGELYAVSNRGLSRVDELEGTSRGHYRRLPIEVVAAGEEESGMITCAEAYYAEGSYDREMWRKNGGKGIGIYSEKEARGYVKRKDRPSHLTFLDHIRIFISTPSD